MQRKLWGVSAVAALAMVGAIGCADLPNVNESECGNLVLDVDEDCDGFSAFGDGTACGDVDSTHACFYTCEAEGTRCPDGWGCGSDGRCRRYSGSYVNAEGSPYSFEVLDFTTGDIDGDGQTDVIGTDRLALHMLFGDDGELSPGARFATSPQRGPVGYGHINGDESVDVAIPIPGGVSVFTGNDGTFDPIIYSPIALDAFIGPNDVLRILPVESVPAPFSPATELILAADVYDGNQIYQGSFMGFFDQPGLGLPGGFRLSDIVGGVDRAFLHPNDDREEFALPFLGASSVWVYTSTGDGGVGTPLELLLHQKVDLPAGATLEAGAMFADVDGRLGPDLMISIKDGAGLSRVAIAFNDGNGNLGVPFIHPMFERGGFGHPWPLAAGELGNDERADYVFPEGVYLSERIAAGPGLPETMWLVQPATTAIWNRATIGDFNGDGARDVAMASTQVDGIDVYINAPGLYFNQFRIDTSDPPTALRTGDFNGDLNDDVAFVLSGLGDEEDRIKVIFGTGDGPEDTPVDMGKLGRIRVFEIIHGGITFEFDGIHDIITVSSPISDPTSQQLAILQGSTSSRLTSPFSLLHESLELGDVALHTMIGHYDTDGKADIIAIGHDPNDTAIRKHHIWMLPGSTGDGSLDTNSVELTEIPTSNFRVGCSLWVLGDVDGDGRDDVFGVDRTFLCPTQQGPPNLAVATPSSGGGDPFTIRFEASTIELRSIEDLKLADLDADGDLDLLMHFGGAFEGNGTERKGNGVAVAWNEGGTISFSSLSEVTIANTIITGVTWARHSDSPVPALVLSTNNRVQLVELGSDKRTYGAPRALQFPSGNGRVRAADLDGDGLTDIAYMIGSDLRVLSAVPAEPLGKAPPPDME